MSKRTTVYVVALALVIGGTVAYAWPMLEHPTTWTDTRIWGGFIVAVIGVDIALILGERLRAHEQQAWTQAGQSCDVRRNARWKSGRRAIQVFILSPLGILLSLPDWRHFDGDSPTIETFKFLWRIGEVICDIYGGIRGDPLVIYGTVHEKYDYDFEDMVTGFGTFGYVLRVDIKRAVRIARNGRTRDDAKRIQSDDLVRSTRHVYRQTSDGQDVILLCNSVGTALAVESEIRDAALISALRGSLAKESDAGTQSSEASVPDVPEASDPGAEASAAKNRAKAAADAEGVAERT